MICQRCGLFMNKVEEEHSLGGGHSNPLMCVLVLKQKLKEVCPYDIDMEQKSLEAFNKGEARPIEEVIDEFKRRSHES